MVIWKWTLKITDIQTLSMPKGAQVLSVQMQRDEPQLWALVDQDAPCESRVFVTYGTGHVVEDFGVKYVGTYQCHGSLVFHVFEGV